MSLIDELKNDHTALAWALDEVSKLGIGTPQARKLLLQAKDELLGHLKKEDEMLYPVLKKAAESNESVKSILKNFAGEMDEISRFAMEFFDKYTVENIDPSIGSNFSADFGRLFAYLKTRIRREENILYNEYLKIQ